MEMGYFAAVWGDLTKTPGWFPKMLKLALVALIPVFGLIVIYGYLYGWAREIAWNVHRPLPERIFHDGDGTLYKRGFFIWVIALVCALVPSLLSAIGSGISGATTWGSSWIFESAEYSAIAPTIGALLAGGLFGILEFAFAVAMGFLFWVASMRTAIYGTLSSGFQLKKIWVMLRHDFPGLLRIFGMSLILGAAISLVCVIGVLLGVLAGVIVAIAAAGDATGLIEIALIVIGMLVLIYLVLVLSMIAETLIIRALGYWTRQFDVAQWGGQDDPLPCERQGA